MGAHVGLLPDRTPLWRLFPLPGTTTRRLSPQKHPPDPPCRPSGCGGLPLASSQQHGQLDLWAGRAGTRQTWTGGAHRLDSTTTESALLRHSSRRLVQFSSAATDGRRPSSLPPTAKHNSTAEKTNNAPLFKASRDAVDITLTDTTRRTPAFLTRRTIRYRTQKRPTTQSVVREILV